MNMEGNDNIDSNPNQGLAYRTKKVRGDRKDGWILKDLSSFSKLVPHLMTSRDSSSIYFKEKLDVTLFVEYINQKNLELSSNPIETPYGVVDKITYFNVFIAALVRLLTFKPHMNRFIAGRKFYQRKTIDVSFVVKKEFTEEGEETIIKKSFTRDENLWSIVSKLHKEIRTVKSEKTAEADDIINMFASFPGPIVNLAMKFLDFLNSIGKYPEDIRRDDPMHASVFITNLGSIGVRNVPYHHLFDWGTNSVFVCLGEIYKDYIYNPETDEHDERYLVEVSTTIDERISDGFYYTSAMNKFKEILNNPEELEEKLTNYPVDQ